MRILIVSDTHGRFSRFENLIAKIGQPDMLIHCGDLEGSEDYITGMVKCPCHIVKGNCDFGADLPAEEVVEAGGHRIFVTHGHRYKVNYGVDMLREAAIAHDCDIALYGHTHVPFVEYGSQVSIANPGSLSQPRQGDGRPTYMILEFDQNGQPFFALNYLE